MLNISIAAGQTEYNFKRCISVSLNLVDVRVAYLNFITDKIQSLLCDISSSQKMRIYPIFFGNPFENVEHLNRSHTGQRKSISHKTIYYLEKTL